MRIVNVIEAVRVLKLGGAVQSLDRDGVPDSEVWDGDSELEVYEDGGDWDWRSWEWEDFATAVESLWAVVREPAE